MEQQAGTRLPFEIRIDRQAESVLVALFGELDLTARSDFEEGLSNVGSDPVTQVVVDLSGLTFVDSSGLILLVEFWKRCRGQGISILFEGGSEQVRSAFEATGLDQVLPRVGPRNTMRGRHALSPERERPQPPPRFETPSQAQRTGIPSFLPPRKRGV